MSLHRRILLSSEINGRDLYQYSSSPPLPTNLLADSSTAVPFQRHLSNAAIAAVSAISAAIFLALTYYSVLRHRRRRLLDHSDESYYSAGDETSDDDGVGAHHVWNIRTVGLDNSAILSLGSYAYLPPSGTDGGGLAATADCPVCLGGLEDGDMVRLLPTCGHVFHVSCIDPWLRAHVSCPLCRAHIPPPQPSAAGGADGEARVLSDTEAPPSPPPPPPPPEEEEDDPGSPIDHRSVTTETEMEERGSEERKDDNSGEDSWKEVEVPSSSGSGRVFFFARMSRGRSGSVLPV
ncbi:putative E3 ubiquitin-protein ligase-like [Iris pallida]|uniref:RING-type E3 ubiquitin transferase n=1 Tax=Iris pallida TaxID=29817 RepID=A0AAX6H0F1_IRIPA|nr:putative E3 ubiquitin-protein ligase-like [Iris pallida]